MLRLLAIAAFATLIACDTPCKSNSDCGTGNTCVLSIQRCRKVCTTPNECSGQQVCSPIRESFFACLNPSEIIGQGDPNNNDMSLGNICISPANNGVSAATGGLETCGSNTTLCNTVFQGDPGLGDIQTCTTECSADADCALESPTNCQGECRRDFDNTCCFPSLPIKDAKQYSGAKTSAPGVPYPLYCRPRLFCYFVPKRCKADSDCGKTGNRAGDKCTTTTDGGGACLSGKLNLFECCQREGECNQATAMGGQGGLSCTASLDNLSGYCSKPCAADADCASAATPGYCWTTTYEFSSIEGQCTVVVNPKPVCRTQPPPAIQNPASKLVKCDFQDRPATLGDNKYNASLRRCDRTF